MLANQIRPTTLSAAIVFRVHPFLAKKHRDLPFLATALKLNHINHYAGIKTSQTRSSLESRCTVNKRGIRDQDRTTI